MTLFLETVAASPVDAYMIFISQTIDNVLDVTSFPKGRSHTTNEFPQHYIQQPVLHKTILHNYHVASFYRW